MFDALVYQLQYTVLTLLAALFWIINQALLYMSALCYAVKKTIIDVTAPDAQHAGFVLQVLDHMLRDQSTSSIQQLVYLSLSLAVLLLFGAMVVRPIMTANPVDPKRALLWLFASSMLFSAGSGFFLSLEQLRENVREMAQTVVLQAGLTASNPDPSTIHTGLPNQMGPQNHAFPNFIPCQSPPGQPCNGLDLALSYLYITQETEVTQLNGGDPLHQYMPRHFSERNDAGSNDPSVPLQQGYAGYFYWDQAQGDLSDNTRRQTAVNDAVQGVLRMLTALPISLFALLEAVVYLVFTLSAAILFFSVPIALVFAFFQSTEVIVVGVLRAYMTLFIKTYAAAAMLTLIFTFLLFWAQQGNAGAFLTVTLVMLIFSWQFVGMAWQTLKGSFSMVTDQLNHAVGTRPTPLSTAPIPTISPDGQIRMQGGFAGLRASRGVLALARGPMPTRNGDAARPLFGIEADRHPAGDLAGAAWQAAAGGVGAGAATLFAGALGGMGAPAATTAEEPRRAGSSRPPGRRRDGPAGGTARPATAMLETAGPDAAGADTAAARGAGSLQPVAGGWWRNEERGRETGQVLARAATAADPPAGVAQTDLGGADQARVAAALQADPATAHAILHAADATFKGPVTAGLAYLDAGGNLAFGSPGMQAMLTELAAAVPPGTVTRLTEEPAGQEQVRALVGARGGFERQWPEEEVLEQLSAAARTPGASLATLTTQMGVPGSTFGGASPTLDHLVRELHELDLADPPTVRDLVQSARRMQQANPETTFSAEALQRFAAEQDLDSSVSWSLIRLQEQTAARARERGDDPARSAQAVSRLMRDTLAVPTQLFTPTLPALPPEGSGQPGPTPATPAGRVVLPGGPLAVVVPPDGTGSGRPRPEGAAGRGPRSRGAAGGSLRPARSLAEPPETETRESAGAGDPPLPVPVEIARAAAAPPAPADPATRDGPATPLDLPPAPDPTLDAPSGGGTASLTLRAPGPATVGGRSGDPPATEARPAAEGGPAPPDPVLSLQIGFQEGPQAQLAAVQTAPAADPGVREFLLAQLVAPTTTPAVRTAIATTLQPVAPALQEMLADLPVAPDPSTQILVDQLRMASRSGASPQQPQMEKES